jgi:signal transduction histidine kinase
VDRLIGLVQDIDHLLGDSMHSLTQASVMMARHANVLGTGPGGEVLKQLREASDKLEKVSELVHAALQGRAVPLGSPLLSRARPITLREAIEHAVEVLTPMIDGANTRVRLQVPDDIGASPSGTMYTVVLNGLQNALEAIQRRAGQGHITITVRPDSPPARTSYGKDARPWYCLEIIDDGVGPPVMNNTERVFDLGYTTKSRGAGVGLAVARSVIQSMGGTIELFANLDKAPAGTKGAVLRAKFPSPDASANIRIGGAA